MNWLQVLGPSLLMVFGGIITWFIKSRVEELRAIEEKLREERRKIYGQILDPYIHLFAELKGQGPTQAIKLLHMSTRRQLLISTCLVLMK